MELEEPSSSSTSSPSSPHHRRRRGSATRGDSSSSGLATPTITTPLRRLLRTINPTIPHAPFPHGGDPRDYLALERTYLSWLRTSLTLVSMGVVVTQLFVLDALDRPRGTALGGTLVGCGGLVALVGAARYFRCQAALGRGKARIGGWDLVGLMVVGGVGLVAGLLGVIVAVK